MISPFSNRKLILGGCKSSSSEGVGDGRKGGGLLESCWSEYGDGGFEITCESENIEYSVRERDDSNESKKADGEGMGVGGQSEVFVEVEHEPHEADTLPRGWPHYGARKLT